MHVKLRPEPRRRLWRLFIPFALIAAAIATIGGPAQAAPTPSTFEATLAPAVSGIARAGVGDTLTFKIKNTGGPLSIGSVNITLPPTGFDVADPTVTETDPPGKDWTGSVVGSVVQLRALKSGNFPPLMLGESLTATMEVTECDPGSYTLGVAASQSRTFSGKASFTGNNVSVRCYDAVCPSGACLKNDETITLSTEVPANGILGINFEGTPADFCGVAETPITRIQLDPLNYVEGYTATFTVVGATETTVVCKNDQQLFFCEGPSEVACILTASPTEGGFVYEIRFPEGDPNIDFG
jgi:hypothetical protein